MQGTYKDGKVILDTPADWPEGCRVTVEPASREETFGIPESEWKDTPEAIEEWLRWYDSLEPLILTPEEEAEIAAALRESKEYDKAKMQKRIDGIFE